MTGEREKEKRTMQIKKGRDLTDGSRNVEKSVCGESENGGMGEDGEKGGKE